MSTLSRNVAFNVVGQFVSLVLGLFAARVLYQSLGSGAVGMVFLAVAAQNILVAVLDLGLASTVIREVATSGAHSARGRGLIRSVSTFYWAGWLILAGLASFGSGVVVRHWLNVGELDLRTATTSLAVLSVGVSLALPKSLYVALFRGLQRMDITNAIDVCTIALQQSGMIAIVLFKGTLVDISIWIAATTALGLTVYVLVARRHFPPDALRPGYDAGAIRMTWTYTSRMTAVSTLAALHTHADKLVISRLLPIDQLGIYVFASSSISRGMLLTGAIAQAAFPSMTQLHDAERRQELLDQYRKLHQCVSFLMLIVFAAVPFVAEPVLGFAFGSTDAARMLLPATLLAVGFYMNSTLNMPYVLSLAMGRPDIALASNLWSVVLILPATIWLVSSFGLVGAASSWVVYHLFAYAYFIPRVSRECLQIRPSDWYARLLVFVLFGGVLYGLTWAAVIAWSDGRLVAGLTAYVVATFIYVLSGTRLLDSDVRERLRQLPYRFKAGT